MQHNANVNNDKDNAEPENIDADEKVFLNQNSLLDNEEENYFQPKDGARYFNYKDNDTKLDSIENISPPDIVEDIKPDKVEDKIRQQNYDSLKEDNEENKIKPNKVRVRGRIRIVSKLR